MWSDAARRAAILARRMKRVDSFNARTPKQVDQQAYLRAKIGMRLKRVSHYSRTRVSQTIGSAKMGLAIERGGSYLPRIMRRR